MLGIINTNTVRYTHIHSQTSWTASQLVYWLLIDMANRSRNIRKMTAKNKHGKSAVTCCAVAGIAANCYGKYWIMKCLCIPLALGLFCCWRRRGDRRQWKVQGQYSDLPSFVFANYLFEDVVPQYGLTKIWLTFEFNIIDIDKKF